ncbi:hypothetical protein [Solwaraspora sp. WMMD792]|uniref:hypothetical protein n=1 Tax=Solwaraspora sp. WMMD792 TaxID=3016099 RepID=UPI002415AE89|nr:hypothetical protein [Solwaraspora sp. WMMD792]MDG4774047.1 hypothetical protein [Solwaraspora sp. WMMD792]
MNPRPFFIRLGPSRWWYVAGLALWVAGFVGLFGYGYTAKSQRDAAAVDLSRAAIDDTVTVQVADGGEYGVWLETVAGADRPDAVQRLIDAAPPRLIEVEVTTADGEPVLVGPAYGYDHRVTTGAAQLLGWSVGEMALAPGEYRVALADAERYAGDGVAGFAVGPLPPEPDGRAAGAGLVGPAAGLLVCLVTLILRQRATSRAARP